MFLLFKELKKIIYFSYIKNQYIVCNGKNRNKSTQNLDKAGREVLKKRFTIRPPDFDSVFIGQKAISDNKNETNTMSIYDTKEKTKNNHVSRVKRIMSQEIRRATYMNLPSNLKNRLKERSSNTLTQFCKQREHNFSRYENISKEVWEEILSNGAKTFSPESIPLAVKMCRFIPNIVHQYDSLPASSNIELLKIPNFLHLTPNIVKKQCEQLKKLMNKWPKDLPPLPFGIHYKNYIYADITPEYPKSRIACVDIDIDRLNLNSIQKLKLILLAANSYDISNNKIVIEAHECPTRSQNIQYAQYRLARLLTEARVITEEDKRNLDCNNFERTKAEIVAKLIRKMEKQPNMNSPPYQKKVHENIIDFNDAGYPFIAEIKPLGIRNPYTVNDVISDTSFLNCPNDYVKYPSKVFIRERFDPTTMVKLESGTYAKIIKNSSELVIR